MIILHDPRCVEYARPGHVECPARIMGTVPVVRERHPGWEWRVPKIADKAALRRAHTEAHIETVRVAAVDFDPDSPTYPDIYNHAARASGAALEAARLALSGEPAFSLMRPPGHHATREQAMGFCYFNHIAVAALAALEGGIDRVAIWDFDAHHGNGTEAIVRGNERIAFASIHQHPAYPGSGTQSFENISNFPVAPGTPRAAHMSVIERALQTLLEFKPGLLLVSAGFDAYAGDPITQMTLQPGDFATCGKWLRETGVPAGAILEGGYSDELQELIDAFLTAWIGIEKTPCPL
jgi:acetoin utilization deacetylase AcuC-like enzyme